MNFIDALYTAADNAGIPTTKIGPKLGLSRNYIATLKYKRINPSITNGARLFGACGYVLAAVPGDQVPDGAIVLDGGDIDDQVDTSAS